MLDAITYTEARKNLAGLMDAVCDNIDAVVITRRKSRPVVLMSLDEYNSIKETNYLLTQPQLSDLFSMRRPVINYTYLHIIFYVIPRKPPKTTFGHLEK